MQGKSLATPFDSAHRRPSFLGRKPPFKQQDLSQHDSYRIVDVRHLNRHDSGLGLANQGSEVPTEVTAPGLLARVEKRIQLAAQQTGKVRAFGPVTLGACPAEAVGIVRASMLPRDDVLDLELKRAGVVFVKAAVFAATSCPLPHEGPERGIHHSPEELARSWRALDLRMATNVLKET